ncbi:DUF881 domain-containing protein [Desulfofundulus thermosubterraneus]|uniref:Uncharacterized conserved protein YlxW, UPF0749 family n=1 Tax=Desulfofundulus thermosubterraneus DSM 16057 TaxID=1121432 RepID=A0A1M6CE27_9FIRM|nr:DUF881 domain-containing protein [Desulfofundulus thermosubterraneus]SHI59014.1 Uncharacterized conserved protein YlxW, UPF0749 family [Desulfofundulus thermosubterraneus DSM 16057]
MKLSTYLSLGLVALVLGVLIVFQFRVTRHIEQGIPAGRAQELALELRQLEKDKSKLEAEANDLSLKLEQVTRGQTEAEKALKDELAKARLLAGLVSVTGPGIEVTLDNPPQQPGGGGAASLYVIRDEDLLRVINELRGAGAEALSINGQRIVAHSEIRWAAPFINVNLTRVVPPYHILAIGKPDNLKSALEIPGGLVEYLLDLGVQVKIQPYDRLTIPGYSRTTEFRYAKPVVKG